jgi:hypothetical protein
VPAVGKLIESTDALYSLSHFRIFAAAKQSDKT